MNIPFFLVAGIAGAFNLITSYPANPKESLFNIYGDENNATTGSSDAQQLLVLFAANAIASSGIVILTGMFALREWLKILLRCSVANKTSTTRDTQLNLSLNVLSAADHIQSMSPEEVQMTIQYCQNQ